MEKSQLENKVEKKKSAFLKKHAKKIGLTAGGLFLAAAIAASAVVFPKQGTQIQTKPDGKIDTEYYRSLMEKDTPVTDISQIEDLVAEMYCLTYGKPVGDDFAFTFFDENDVPLRGHISSFFHRVPLERILGFNWGNGSVYMRNSPFQTAIPLTMHEIGHGKTGSLFGHIGYLLGSLGNYTEPIADKNSFDSIISLMYLDPDMGYLFFCDYVECYRKFDLFRIQDLLNLVRLARQDDTIIKNVYSSVVDAKQSLKGMETDKDKFLQQVYEGVLAKFEKFKDLPEYDDRLAKIRQYLKYGPTGEVYYKNMTQDEYAAFVKEKEEFLEAPHSKMIQERLARSLMSDYLKLQNKEKREELRGRLSRRGF
jgi:hypothetical protein